jgi:hypothetical protein
MSKRYLVKINNKFAKFWDPLLKQHKFSSQNLWKIKGSMLQLSYVIVIRIKELIYLPFLNQLSLTLTFDIQKHCLNAVIME